MRYFLRGAGAGAIIVGALWASGTAPAEWQAYIREERTAAPIRLTFMGDMMFDRFIRTKGESVGYAALFGDTADLLRESDLVVANLEGPVTSNAPVATYDQGGPNHFRFTFSPTVADVLYEHNVRLVSLANNHMLDFGREGVRETRSFLTASGVTYFGAPGSDMSTIETIKGVRIGFVAYNQFINRDDEETLRTITATDKSDDLTVVFAHWGNEYEAHPTERQIALAHRFVDAGADLVIGTHPHVIQDKETYNGKVIYYSLGNFIFDQYFQKEVRCGLIVEAAIQHDGAYTLTEDHVSLAKDGTTHLMRCASSTPTL